MQTITNVFNRHEIKYILNETQYTQVMEGIRDHMIPDPHGESTICNIYYDTPDDRLVRKSLEGPVYKEKIRLRSYGTAKEDSIVFLELKKKYQGIVYKRRIELPEQTACDYMGGVLSFPELLLQMGQESSPQIAGEIEQFKQFYHQLEPAVYLSYDRSAFFSEEDSSLRITFDQNIRWRKERIRRTAALPGQSSSGDQDSDLSSCVACRSPLQSRGTAFRLLQVRKSVSNQFIEKSRPQLHETASVESKTTTGKCQNQYGIRKLKQKGRIYP